MISVKELEETVTQNMNQKESVEEIDLGGYSPRPLVAKDIIPMTAIIRKAGIRDFANCLNVESVSGLAEEGMIENLGASVVLQIADMLLERIPEIGSELFHFIGNLIGISKEESEELPLDVLANLVERVVHGKEFMGFMKAVLRLFK